MAATTVVKIFPHICEIQSSQERKTWDWGIYPLTVFAHCCGVDLKRATRSATDRAIWISYGATIFFLNFAVQIFYIHSTVLNLPGIADSVLEKKIYKSKASQWTVGLDAYNFGLHLVIIHLLSVTVVSYRWKFLFESFLKGSEMFSETFILRLRRLSIIGISIIILEVRRFTFPCTYCSTLLLQVGTGILNYLIVIQFPGYFEMLVYLLMNFGLIYQSVVLLLYALSCLTVSYLYISMKQEFQIWRNQPKNLRSASKLRKIKTHHMVACEAIEAINHCFGLSLIFNSTFLVVGSITYVFYVVGHNLNIFNHTTFLTYNLTQTIILCFPSENIRNKVCYKFLKYFQRRKS